MASKLPIPKHLPCIDLLNSLEANSFLAMWECELFYSCINLAHDRRNFHPQLLNTAHQFLIATESEASHVLIDEFISRTFRDDTDERTNTKLIKQVSEQNPIGYKLLKMTPSLSLNELKKNYKLAALKNHPDHGGNHNTMVLLNDAYIELSFLIVEREAPASGLNTQYLSLGGVPKIAESCNDYRNKITRILLTTYIEEWDILEAFSCFKSLISENWKLTAYTKNRARKDELINISRKFIGQLMLANLADEAVFVFDIVREYENVLLEREISPRSRLYDCDLFINKSKKHNIVICHPNQAFNMLKFGIIDSKRHKEFFKKYEKTKKENDIKENDIRHLFNTYIEINTFLQSLPSDVCCNGKEISHNLVPFPGYFKTRIESLSASQQAEYANAFGKIPDMNLVIKYLYVRLHSLFDSVIYYDNYPNFDEITSEISFLSQIGSPGFQRYALNVINTIVFLSNLEPIEFNERITMLRHDANFYPYLDGEFFEIAQWPLTKIKLRIKEYEECDFQRS